MKKTKLNAVVREILEELPESRNNDCLLIAHAIYQLFGATDVFAIVHDETVNGNVYESIRRTRQKIQQTNPLLKAVPAVAEMRAEKEKKIRKEMRGV